MPRLKKIITSPESLTVLPTAVPATADLIPSDVFGWKRVVPVLHRVGQLFGYQRVETSPVESFDRFSLALRPNPSETAERLVKLDPSAYKKSVLRAENFSSVIRAYSTHRLWEHERVTKWYYLEPAFLADKNQLTHVYEYGMVNFGDPSAVSEAHLMLTLTHLLQALGAPTVLFEINSRGCEDCAPYYEEIATQFLQENRDALCPSCLQLISRELRSHAKVTSAIYDILSCTDALCQGVIAAAPQRIDYLDASCNRQLTALLENLDEVEVSYQLNPHLFGSSMFSHGVFRPKILPTTEGAQELEFGIGGRHSRFVSRLTGQQIPTLAFSVPLATLFALTEFASHRSVERVADVFLINLGDMAAKKSLRLFRDLLHSGIAVTEHFGENGIRNQFKLAERNGCPIVLLIGQKEALEGTVILREIRTGIQEVFSYERIIDEVRKRLQD